MQSVNRRGVSVSLGYQLPYPLSINGKMQDDKQFVFKAVADAQKAIDYIVGNQFEEAEA